jgi:hypothetical protein
MKEYLMLAKSNQLCHRSQHFANAGVGAFLLVAVFCQTAAAVDDVLLQTTAGKIVTGVVDDNTFMGTLGERVHRQQFLSNFRSANPGFVSLATGSPSMPAGAHGFPSNHDVSFDLLPMAIGQVASNLFYWDGNDMNGNGLSLSDVNFTVPAGVSWDVFDADFNVFSVNGTNQLVPGGLIQQTSSDIDPFDGVNTGAIHKHLVLQLSDNDGNPNTSPAQGVYMIAWQARSVGFETSDPFLFVLRTAGILDAVRNLAADWAEAHIEMLTSPPKLLGDYNFDGIVDAADYVVWRDTLNSTTQLAADGDMNGTVDVGDFGVWRANFGAVMSGAAAAVHAVAVPEGSAIGLALIALSCVGLSRNFLCKRAPNWRNSAAVHSASWTASDSVDTLKLGAKLPAGFPAAKAASPGTGIDDRHPRAHEAVSQRWAGDPGGRSAVADRVGGRGLRPVGPEWGGEDDDDSDDHRFVAAGSWLRRGGRVSHG